MENADQSAYEDWIALDDYTYVPFKITVDKSSESDIDAFQKELKQLSDSVRGREIKALRLERQSLGKWDTSLIRTAMKAQLPYRRTKVIVAEARKGSLSLKER
jgi:hypothetical protein